MHLFSFLLYVLCVKYIPNEKIDVCSFAMKSYFTCFRYICVNLNASLQILYELTSFYLKVYWTSLGLFLAKAQFPSPVKVKLGTRSTSGQSTVTYVVASFQRHEPLFMFFVYALKYGELSDEVAHARRLRQHH